MAVAPILIVATVLSAAATVYGGIQQRNAADAQANAVDAQRHANDAQAAVDANNRQDKLQRLLSSQIAMFGSSGTALGSGSQMAIQNDTISQTNDQQRLANVATLARDQSYEATEKADRAGGNAALVGSIISAGGKIGSAFAGGMGGTASTATSAAGSSDVINTVSTPAVSSTPLPSLR